MLQINFFLSFFSKSNKVNEKLQWEERNLEDILYFESI